MNNFLRHILKNGEERITSDYGNRSFSFNGKKYSGFHKGIDVVSGKYGTDYIIAYDKGKIIDLRNSIKGYDEKNSSGNYVIINHNNNYVTKYFHLKYNSIKVKKGDNVIKGQVIAYMGSTGFSTGNHVHFELLENNNNIDPKLFLIEQIEENENNKYKIGDNILFTGFLYRDSYGNGRGKKLSNYRCTISKINEKGSCIYNINNGLGWIKESDIIKSNEIEYNVKKGDTLWSIAKYFYNDGNKYYRIAKLNNLFSPYFIRPNQKLRIPLN